jgi:hypothetical protein
LGLTSLSTTGQAYAATAVNCNFSHGHSQEPLGLNVWTVTVHNGISCGNYLEYVSVATGLQVNGSSRASDSASCTTCAGTVAKAGPVPAQAGQTITNHGTWDALAPVGWKWTTYPRYCTLVSSREVQCTRNGQFTAGKTADLVNAGADIGAISLDV